ncbi:MAG: hypothetical protein JKY31_09830 [Rhodobacteraceae bacterium]|nr:hypothetical protein [Paracoccaceae bacterium]
MRIPKQSLIVYLVWMFLLVEVLVSAWLMAWSEAFVALLTLGLTFLPVVFEDRLRIHLPLSVGAVMVLFLFGTLFLGEVGDFYEKYWWWDVLLHSASAIGFGLIGFVLIFMLFEGDRYAAPPRSIAFLSFCFALAIGAMWEVFEYLMDIAFGLSMQKSGLDDTMWDMIVNMIGASIGALAGYFYLREKWFVGLARMIDQFVKANKKLFRKNK